MGGNVLLTGIGSFVGIHCAAELIRQGYIVKGSLRDLSKSDEISKALGKQVDIKDKLTFCELDLTKDENWDECMKGCDFLMHVASPNVLTEPKNADEILKPAVDGTLRALRAAKKANVKRAVVTSTILTMGAHRKEGVFGPNSWTDASSKKINTYTRSKTLAEKAAWDFFNNQDDGSNMELVVINPGAVMGPAISENLSRSSPDSTAQLITGKMSMIPDMSLNFTDVRDVAKIHVQALETPGISGKRFVVAHAEPKSYMDVAKYVKGLGYEKVSTKAAPGFMLKLLSLFNREVKGLSSFLGMKQTADNSDTIETFKWDPISIEQTLEDGAKSVQLILDKNN